MFKSIARLSESNQTIAHILTYLEGLQQRRMASSFTIYSQR